MFNAECIQYLHSLDTLCTYECDLRGPVVFGESCSCPEARGEGKELLPELPKLLEVVFKMGNGGNVDGVFKSRPLELPVGVVVLSWGEGREKCTTKHWNWETIIVKFRILVYSLWGGGTSTILESLI